ncbi:MAG: hypothetical protein IT548_02485 [Alphaproteobacteria bacterium]|nr:hypothetical protein [Alphaproteobacteria bacterium]
MDPKLLMGLGLSLAFACLRYAVPAVPPVLAWSGFGVGIGLIGASATAQLYPLAAYWFPISAVAAAAIGGLLAWLASRRKKPAIKPAEEGPWYPKPLRRLFDEDFTSDTKVSVDIEMKQLDGTVALKMPTHALLNFSANTKYIAFFIPRSPHAFEACRSCIVEARRYLSEMLQNFGIDYSYPGEVGTKNLDTLTFSRRVVIYHEDSFDVHQLAELDLLATQADILLIVRGPQFHATRMLGGPKSVTHTQEKPADA